MTSEYDRQRDIEAEGQRAAIYHGKQREAQEKGGSEADFIAGWEACRKSIYAVCEDVDREASDVEDRNPQFSFGMKRAAKSIARGFGSMDAMDDDNLIAAMGEKN